MIAINTLGVLSILENGESIKNVADLKGKKIGATGQSATPEYVLNYILEANGIDPKKDVEITPLHRPRRACNAHGDRQNRHRDAPRAQCYDRHGEKTAPFARRLT